MTHESSFKLAIIYRKFYELTGHLLMTKKLYYENLYSREFDANIIDIQGNNIILDETLFYPSGGGQPCDIGFIDDIAVVDVHEKNGEIIHVLSEPIHEYKQIHGVIDWEKRFELMQQHLGEHIFAGELYNLHGLHTARMRIEGDNVSIDVDTPVDEKIILEAESLANEAIYKDIPVEIIYPEMSEIKELARKLPPEHNSEPVRIVKIEGVDYVPCCGLHVSTTGQVGLIKITSHENHKGGTRIYLKSGRAAYRWVDSVYREVRRAESELVCGYMGINEKILNLKSQIDSLKLQNENNILRYLRPLAENLINTAKNFGDFKLVKHVIKDSTQDEIKHLFKLLTESDKNLVVLLACENENNDGAFIMFGCNRENKNIDVRPAFKSAIKKLNGKGGGSAFSCQGFSEKTDLLNQVLDSAVNELVNK